MTDRIAALSSLPVNAAILNRDGIIVSVNDGWADFAAANGFSGADQGIGLNYLAVTRQALGPHSRLAEELGDLLAGRIGLLTMPYPCHGPDRHRWFVLVGLPLAEDKAVGAADAEEMRARSGPRGAALLHIDISHLLDAQVVARGLRPEYPLDADTLSDALRQSLQHMLPALLDRRGALPAPAAEDRGAAAEMLDWVSRELTERQLEVLRLLGRGLNNADIAAALSLSPNTVKFHVSTIIRRLELESRTQAAVLAAQLPAV